MVLRKPEIKYNGHFLVPRCSCGCGKGLDDLVSSLPNHLLWLYVIKISPDHSSNTSSKYSTFPFPPLYYWWQRGWLGCFIRYELKDMTWFSFNTSCFTSSLCFTFVNCRSLYCQFFCFLGWFHLYSSEIYIWGIWVLVPAAALKYSISISTSLSPRLPISDVIAPK